MLSINDTATALVDKNGNILEYWYDGSPIMVDYKCDIEHLENMLLERERIEKEYRCVRIKLIEIDDIDQ